MRGYTIFLALFMFSVSANMITLLSVDGESVYGVSPAHQGLNISESDASAFTPSEEDASGLDMLNMAGFVLFKMFPMLLKSVWNAFYIVGWLGNYGIPTLVAWIFQAPLWVIYSWEIFQIMTNRSVKAVE
jgi:hypothetical protein